MYYTAGPNGASLSVFRSLLKLKNTTFHQEKPILATQRKIISSSMFSNEKTKKAFLNINSEKKIIGILHY